MKRFLSQSVVLAVWCLWQLPADAQTFGGYECTVDCSGHEAGFRWAEEHDITSSQDCPDGNSNSFHEGCLARTENPGADVESLEEKEPD